MKTSSAALFATTLLFGAPGAVAQSTSAAKTDTGGMHYCYSTTTPSYTLREDGKGSFRSTYNSRVTAPLTAITPASAAALFSMRDGFKPAIGLIYDVTVDATGKIVAEQPNSVSVTFGQLTATEPLANLTLELAAGKTTATIPIDASAFGSMALIRGTLYADTLPAAVTKSGKAVPMLDLMRVVMAAKAAPATLVLKRGGAPIAQVALPRPDFVGDRKKATDWIVGAAPLLAKGQCR